MTYNVWINEWPFDKFRLVDISGQNKEFLWIDARNPNCFINRNLCRILSQGGELYGDGPFESIDEAVYAVTEVMKKTIIGTI